MFSATDLYASIMFLTTLLSATFKLFRSLWRIHNAGTSAPLHGISYYTRFPDICLMSIITIFFNYASEAFCKNIYFMIIYIHFRSFKINSIVCNKFANANRWSRVAVRKRTQLNFLTSSSPIFSYESIRLAPLWFSQRLTYGWCPCSFIVTGLLVIIWSLFQKYFETGIKWIPTDGIYKTKKLKKSNLQFCSD